MGSRASRKQRKTNRETDQANTRAIFFGCYGKRCKGSAFDSPQFQTSPGSLVSFHSDGTSRLVVPLKDKILPDIDEGNRSMSKERYCSLEDWLQIENIMFASLSPKTLLSPPFSRTASITSSGTYRSFEPTPLTQVLPQLYLGTEQDAQQAERLIGLGITHIISIVGGGRYKDLYPKHIYIPLRDNGSSNLLEKLENSYDFMMESQEPGNKLFIHCQLGQNRSASLVIGFLMKSTNLSLYEAYTLVKEKRELIHPHKKYLEQLRQLDLNLHKVYSTPENFLDIALCSKEEIKIMHHNFSKNDSEIYKKTQISNLKDDDNSLSSQSSLLLQEVGNGDPTQFITIPLPDTEFSESSRSLYQPFGSKTC